MCKENDTKESFGQTVLGCLGLIIIGGICTVVAILGLFNWSISTLLKG